MLPTHAMNKLSIFVIILIAALLAISIFFVARPSPTISNASNQNTNSIVVQNTNASVTVLKPQIPTTETDCVSQKGTWKEWGNVTKGYRSCVLTASDSGKRCLHTSQCQGECIAESSASTFGTCSSTIPVTLSCWRMFDGVPLGETCY